MGDLRQTKDINLEQDRMWVMSLLQAAQTRKMYGSLTLVFENGSVTRIKKDETLLPPRGGDAKATS